MKSNLGLNVVNLKPSNNVPQKVCAFSVDCDTNIVVVKYFPARFGVTAVKFVEMSSSNASYNSDVLPELLPIYYKRLFPYGPYYKWLSYGGGKKVITLWTVQVVFKGIGQTLQWQATRFTSIFPFQPELVNLTRTCPNGESTETLVALNMFLCTRVSFSFGSRRLDYWFEASIKSPRWTPVPEGSALPK